MTLSKYKQSVINAIVDQESNALPNYTQQIKQAIQPKSPILPIQTQPINTNFNPVEEVRPFTTVQPLYTQNDFTQGFTSHTQPIKQTQNIAPQAQKSPITDFTPQVSDNKFVGTQKNIKGGVDTLDEASYLLERGMNTVGNWINQVPAFLGTIGLKKDQDNQVTPQEQIDKLKALGMDTSKLPEGYGQALAKTTNLPKTQKFWEDVITYEVVKDRSQEINEKYQGKIDDFTKLAGDVSSGALDMLPQTALAYFTGGTSAMAYVFANSTSQATKNAVQLGAEPEQAKTYGILMGAIEVGTEMLSGGWAGVPKGKFTGLAKEGLLGTLEKATLKLAKTEVGQKAISMAYQYLGEGAEEYLSEVLGNYANAVIGEDVQSLGDIQEEALYSGLIGTLTAVVADLGRIAVVKTAEDVAKKQMEEFSSMDFEQQNNYAKTVLAKTNTDLVFADEYNGQQVKGAGMFTVEDGKKTVVLPTKMQNGEENILTVSLMHEFTHTLEQSGQYEKFKQNVLNNLDNSGILDIMRQTKEKLYKNENLTKDEIDSEIVATFIQDNLFKKVVNVDGKMQSYTDIISFRKFLGDLSVKDRGLLKKTLNGFLQSYYQGTMTEQYDGLVEKYNNAVKNNDVELAQNISKQLIQVSQQLDQVNPSIAKSLEFSFNQLVNDVENNKQQVKDQTIQNQIEPTETKFMKEEDTNEVLEIGIPSDDKLVALHNIELDNLNRVLDLEGFPMPSIAVTKLGIPHTNFGSTTIIFKPDVLDDSPTFWRDAWSPTFPKTFEGFKNEKDFNNFLSRLNAINNNIIFPISKQEYENNVSRLTKLRNSYNSFNAEDYNNAIDSLNYSQFPFTIRDIKDGKVNENDENSIKKYSQEISSWGNYRSSLGQSVVEHKLEIKDFMRSFGSDQLVVNKEELKSKKPLSEISNTFNAENVVKAMMVDNIIGGERKNIPLSFGSVSVNIRDIMRNKGEVAKNRDLLGRLTERDRFNMAHAFEDGLFLIKDNLSKTDGGSLEGKEFNNMLIEYINKNGININSKSFESFMRENWLDISKTPLTEDVKTMLKSIDKNIDVDNMNIADAFVTLTNSIKNVLTPMFESKPQRVVGFDEVELVVIPDYTPENIKDKLTSKGIDYEEYNTPEQRQQIIKNQKSVQFMLEEEPTQVDRFAEPTLKKIIEKDTNTGKWFQSDNDVIDIMGRIDDGDIPQIEQIYFKDKFATDPTDLSTVSDSVKGKGNATKELENVIKQFAEKGFDKFKITIMNNDSQRLAKRLVDKGIITEETPYKYEGQDVVYKINKPLSTKTIEQVVEQVDRFAEPTLEELNKPIELSEPVKMAKRTFPKTITRSYIDKSAKNALSQMMEDGEPMTVYEVATDKKALEKSNAIIGDDYNKAYDTFKALFDSNQVINKDMSVVAQKLLYEFSNPKSKNYNWNKFTDLVAMTSTLHTTYGQFNQSARLMAKLPAGRLMTWEKYLAKLRVEYNNPDLDISQDLMKEMLQQTDSDGMNSVDAKIAEQIGNQLPSTLMDKISAWQFLSMLSNPATDVRNVLGNLFMYSQAYQKDSIGSVLELMLPKEQRTKSALPSWTNPKMKKFLNDTFVDNKEILLSSGPFDIKRDVMNNKTVFKNKMLEKIRIGRFGLLEFEDNIFKSLNFKRILGEQMTAKGLTPETVTKSQLTEMIESSILETQKRTFQQANKLAQKINNAKKNSGVAGKVAIQTIMPFTKTPLNIMATGVEYSPIGILNGISTAVKQLKDGEVNGSQVIDKLSAGLSGSSIAMLGALMYSMGLISGGDDEEGKRKNAFDTTLGAQKYSINFGGQSYSIDWIVPSIMPFMMGVEATKMLEKDYGATMFENAIEATSQIFDPVFELSMLKGVNDALQSYETEGSDRIANILTTMTSNYIMQFFPAIGGALARTIDPEVRVTSNSKDFVAETVNKIQSKIPWLTTMNEPLVNMKGEVVKQQGDIWLRAVQNFLSPTRIKKDISDNTDKEILDVFDQTGDTNAIPKVAPNSITYNGETLTFNAKQKTDYAKTLGTVSYNAVNSVINSKLYGGLSNELKAQVLADSYSYAQEVAKTQYLGKDGKVYVSPKLQSMKEAENNGVNIDEYLIMYNKLSTIETTEDFSKKEQFIADLVNQGYTDDEIYRYLIYVGDYSYTTADQKYINILRGIE